VRKCVCVRAGLVAASISPRIILTSVFSFFHDDPTVPLLRSFSIGAHLFPRFSRANHLQLVGWWGQANLQFASSPVHIHRRRRSPSSLSSVPPTKEEHRLAHPRQMLSLIHQGVCQAFGNGRCLPSRLSVCLERFTSIIRISP